MNQSIQELERDIEETRARLDLTIDRIQDRLSVSGVVDDVMGQVRRSSYSSSMDRALQVVRDNPVPVLLVAAGLGWLLHRMSRDPVVYPPLRRRVYDPAYPADPARRDEFTHPQDPIVASGSAAAEMTETSPLRSKVYAAGGPTRSNV